MWLQQWQTREKAMAGFLDSWQQTILETILKLIASWVPTAHPAQPEPPPLTPSMPSFFPPHHQSHTPSPLLPSFQGLRGIPFPSSAVTSLPWHWDNHPCSTITQETKESFCIFWWKRTCHRNKSKSTLSATPQARNQDKLVLIRFMSCWNFLVTLGITGAPLYQSIYGRQPGTVKTLADRFQVKSWLQYLPAV